MGGRRNSSSAGITADCIRMGNQSITIGYDVIIGWGRAITDSDWHAIKGSPMNCPVQIGNTGWLGHGVSVLKGTTIPDGCIVGAKSMVGAREFQAHSVIAGVPAKHIRNNVDWTR